jgi:molybdopterin molybdotransferase
MHKPFFRVLPIDEALSLLLGFDHLGSESVPIAEARGRVLAGSVTAEEDTPGFDRSTMDGFAVRSADTFGASESSPALMSVIGEVAMGGFSDTAVSKGQAVRIWTGGALPLHADAVVMVEHVEELDGSTIEVFRAVAPYENVVRRGEDFQAGTTLLEKGHRLRPQDLGLLAAMGRVTVEVYRRPRVALISSGDEVVPIDQTPPPGCIRDVNRYALTGMIEEFYAIPVWIGIAPDTREGLAAFVEQGFGSADLVVISGGSSMGSRDHVIDVVNAYQDSQILFHGVGVSPGKPLILSRVGSHPVVGLPGHPVSAMVCFEQFVVPLLRRMEGENARGPYLRPTVTAVLSRNCPSREGRTDFVRVRMENRDGTVFAVPVPGKSGMISSMVRAHGFITIDSDSEGLYRGDPVTVNLFAPWLEEDIETEHISGHEAAGRSTYDLLGAPGPERLSGL